MIAALLIEKFKKHPHPVIPEPSTYGVIFLGLVCIFVLLKTAKR